MRIQYPLLKRHFYRFYRAARRLGRTEATCNPACYQTWIALCATVITSRRPAVGSLFRTLPPRLAGYCKWRSSHASSTSSRASGKGQEKHEVCKSNIKLSGRVNLVWKGIPHACINELTTCIHQLHCFVKLTPSSEICGRSIGSSHEVR